MTPMPSIVVNFRSFALGCDDPTACGVEIADTVLQQGQGMHGSFSRADTRNIMGAVGPDFRVGFTDPAPVSTADLGRTIAQLLDLKIADKGKLIGRNLAEALRNGAQSTAAPRWKHAVFRSEPDALGHRTVVDLQVVGSTRYFDAAGYPGRSVGVSAEPP